MLPHPRIDEENELRSHLGSILADVYNGILLSQSTELPGSTEFSQIISLAPDPILKMFACAFCEDTFKTREGLNKHIGKMHSMKFEGVNCSICQKKFKHKYALRFHIKQVHEKSTRASCQVCGKSYYNKYELSKHLRSAHG